LRLLLLSLLALAALLLGSLAHFIVLLAVFLDKVDAKAAATPVRRLLEFASLNPFHGHFV